jgi:hypothetical protein
VQTHHSISINNSYKEKKDKNKEFVHITKIKHKYTSIMLLSQRSYLTPKKVILIYERKVFFVHDPLLGFERSIEVILPSHIL